MEELIFGITAVPVEVAMEDAVTVFEMVKSRVVAAVVQVAVFKAILHETSIVLQETKLSARVPAKNHGTGFKLPNNRIRHVEFQHRSTLNDIDPVRAQTAEQGSRCRTAEMV